MIHLTGLPIFLECQLQSCCILTHLPPNWRWFYSPLGKETQGRYCNLSKAWKNKQRCPSIQKTSGWLYRQPKPSTFGEGSRVLRTQPCPGRVHIMYMPEQFVRMNENTQREPIVKVKRTEPEGRQRGLWISREKQ